MLARKLAEFFAGGEGEPEFATALAKAVAPILLPAIVVVLLVLAVLIFIDSVAVDAIAAGLAGLASMGAAAANFIGEAIENLGPGASLMRQGIGTLMPQSLRGLSPSLHFDRNGAATITFPAQSGEAALLTDVTFGSVAFRNVPQKDVGGLIVGFVTCFQALSDLATRRLETLGSDGGRVTSTAPQV